MEKPVRMDDSIDFSFPPIRQLHDDRTRRIRKVTRQRTDPAGPAATFSATDYCLAHHVMEGAEAAARAGDKAYFGWYRERPDAGAAAHAIPTDAGPRVIVSPGKELISRPGVSETPYYVLGPETTPAPQPLLTLAACAFAAGNRAGFADLLSAHAVVVCLLHEKEPGKPLHSWTISRLPGTIFCDYTAHAAVLGRDLVHEAAHNWLNDALTATRSLPGSGEPEFFSPWKNAMRPAYGFLHACWAFPLMMLYTSRVIDGAAAGEAKPFLSAYLDGQRLLLAAATRDHETALGLVADRGLRHRLRAARELAATL
jgi:hypothetical protein